MKTTLINKLSYLILIITLSIFTFPAQAYIYQDDPSSTWGGGPIDPIINGNVVTYQNFSAQNLTANALPGLGFAIPFLWPRIDSSSGNTFIPMQWRNDLNGWYSDSFNNTGTSLTVTLTGPASGSVKMGDIADLTGNQQLPLTEPCQSSGSPSCIPAFYPTETRILTDLIPLIPLGPFAANESKQFDLAFTYSYGDQRIAPQRAAFIAYTVSAVPLPSAVWLFGAALTGLIGFTRHKAFPRAGR